MIGNLEYMREHDGDTVNLVFDIKKVSGKKMKTNIRVVERKVSVLRHMSLIKMNSVIQIQVSPFLYRGSALSKNCFYSLCM